MSLLKHFPMSRADANMPKAQSGRHHRVFGVPSSTKEYEYQENCFDIVYRKHDELFSKDTTGQQSPYIIFTSVDELTFLRDFSEGGHTCDSFVPSLKLVLVDMIKPQHERAYLELHAILLHMLASMNSMDTGLISNGHASRKSSDREKRPDMSYEPMDLPAGRSDEWPSFVIEAGWSQTKSKLENDARWWLGASDGDVKGVLTASVHRNKREIVLELWHLVECPLRDDPGKKAVKATQRVVISQATAKDPIQVANAPLVIPFAEIFLRSANAGTQEGDIIIEREQLELYAVKVWKGATIGSA